MRCVRGLAALTVLGAASAAIYAGALPAASWLGVEPIAAHPVVFAILFALYLAAARLAPGQGPSPRARRPPRPPHRPTALSHTSSSSSTKKQLKNNVRHRQEQE